MDKIVKAALDESSAAFKYDWNCVKKN